MPVHTIGQIHNSAVGSGSLWVNVQAAHFYRQPQVSQLAQLEFTDLRTSFAGVCDFLKTCNGVCLNLSTLCHLRQNLIESGLRNKKRRSVDEASQVSQLAQG